MFEKLAYEPVSIDKLVPYANNARLHDQKQIDKVAASIREFGFINPIIVDKDYTILCGHCRYESAKKLGLTTVPVIKEEHLTEAQKKAYIQIFDEKGKMQLSVRRENLLFMEAADNYVNVWYINNNTPKKMMIRSTMKKIQLQMEGTNVLRCHRSYMINLDHVKVLRREKEGIFLEMGIETVPDIPLSKTYSESITRWLMSTQHEDFAS